MSIDKRFETILPNEFLGAMLELDKYKANSVVSLFTLIEQKKLEENKEPYFREFQPQGIRANEEQKHKIKSHFFEIQTKINEYYGPGFVDFYANEIIRNLFPKEAEGIIEARKNIKKDLDETNS